MIYIKDFIYSIIRSFIPESYTKILLRLFTQKLKKEIKYYIENNKLTDKFLELLLESMSWAFYLCKKYRTDNLNFKGSYLFNATDKEEKVEAAVIFEKDRMNVYSEAHGKSDVTVTFANPEALCDYIFSKNQDIIDSLLKNEVEVRGNLNYIYKFGYMARELTELIGVNDEE